MLLAMNFFVSSDLCSLVLSWGGGFLSSCLDDVTVVRLVEAAVLLVPGQKKAL